MDLDNDMVTRILLRLPVQSLLRFRSVCSSWRNIIDSSYFRTSHLQNQRKNQWANDGDDDLRLLQLTNIGMWHQSMDGKLHKCCSAFDEFLAKNCKLFVLGCIDGLICMHNKIQPYMDDPLFIAILNPCLGKIKFLPLSPMCPTIDDGKKWNIFAGFGFDRATNDYKVLQLIKYVNGPFELEVYSLAANTWKKLPNDIGDEHFDGTSFRMTPIRGGSCSSAHWLMKGGSSAHWPVDGRREYFLSFNFEHEEFDMASYPTLVSNKYPRCSPFVFAKDDDSLVLFIRGPGEIKLEMWELERSNKCWSHVRDIDVLGVIGRWYDPDPDPDPFPGPLWGEDPYPGPLWKGDGVVLANFDFKMILYDFSTESVKKIFTDLRDSFMYTLLLEYRSSLVSP